jgi:plastocyanin
MTRRVLMLALIVLAATLGLSACGGGNDEGSNTTTAASGGGGGGGGGGTTLQLAADPGGAFKFDKTSLEAAAGNVTIDFTNDASIPHNVTVEGNGVEDEASDTITQSTATLALNDLKPGTYTFYCSVDAHRQGGMEGTLTIK